MNLRIFSNHFFIKETPEMIILNNKCVQYKINVNNFLYLFLAKYFVICFLYISNTKQQQFQLLQFCRLSFL